MNNIVSLEKKRIQQRKLKRIEEAKIEIASLWVAKLDRELSRSEALELKVWATEDKSHIQILLETAKLWDNMSAMNRLADLFPQSNLGLNQNRKKNWYGAIAASFLFAIAIGLASNFNQQDRTVPSLVNQFAYVKSFQTKIGENKTVPLPDGSELVLNTNTSAKISFSKASRIIELERGEIHIDVAHDKTRPLSVLASGKVIQAVGTAFNVEMANDKVELIVTDGKVLVAPIEKSDSTNKNQTIPHLSSLPNTSIAISKGEKVEFNNQEKTIAEIKKEAVVNIEPVEIAASLSWRTGNLIFRGESLSDAMTEISRYNDIQIEIDDNDYLKNIRVAGMFKTGDIEGLISVLEKNFNITHSRIEQNKIFLKLSENKG